ncbi:carboxylesterase/lipase family protein [Plantactinospora sp. WMMC1484]|uniref:carboxylesterase/lipase family protein n=1 Tax=Plantactinospora sp. WMMC1484 TaxID=3404122 RepID=UPI003BF4AC89
MRHPSTTLPGTLATIFMLLSGSLLLSGSVLPSGSAAAGTTSDGDGDAVVATADGPVRGTVTADHRMFQGIPYAAPPTGGLRLRSPEPAEPWTEVRDATRPGPICTQSYSYPPGSPPVVAGAEDCLYLNVHVPRGVAGPMPVLVFLHGGNSGAGSRYDPRPVTGAGGVVVVTVNYRLGALGFLRHESLDDPYAGNFALADQQAALRWVRTTIGAFGGDPRNVTLWGESYGGFGVCAQLASPAARGLFDKAIVQSAPCGNDLVTRAEADRRGDRAVEALGCADAADVAACLRQVPAERVATLPNTATHQREIAAAMPWFYTVGTPPLPRQPLDAARAGRVHAVPLIHGGTRDEMRGVVATLLDIAETPLTERRYRQIVADLYGRDAGRILARYAPNRYATPSLALATLQTDEGRMVGTCTQLSYSEAHRRLAPVYAYEFAEDSGWSVGDLPLGASHGDDIRYFFDSFPQSRSGAAVGGGARQPESRHVSGPAGREELAAALIERWTGFARTGRPTPDWPPYRAGTALSLSGERITPVDVDREHRCGFWHTVPAR